MMRKILLMSLVVMACEECPIKYPYVDQTDYIVEADEMTESGISVDRSGIDVSLAEIDRLVDEVEECLKKNFPGGKMDFENMAQGGCWNKGFDLPISRECLTVKIAPDCTLNHDGTQELMGAVAPDSACDGKAKEGEDGPNEQWPCKWRAGIQDYHTITTCPSLYLLKDPLIRIATGCNGVWSHPLLAECAAPTTEALSGMVEQ